MKSRMGLSRKCCDEGPADCYIEECSGQIQTLPAGQPPYQLGPYDITTLAVGTVVQSRPPASDFEAFFSPRPSRIQLVKCGCIPKETPFPWAFSPPIDELTSDLDSLGPEQNRNIYTNGEKVTGVSWLPSGVFARTQHPAWKDYTVNLSCSSTSTSELVPWSAAGESRATVLSGPMNGVIGCGFYALAPPGSLGQNKFQKIPRLKIGTKEQLLVAKTGTTQFGYFGPATYDYLDSISLNYSCTIVFSRSGTTVTRTTNWQASGSVDTDEGTVSLSDSGSFNTTGTTGSVPRYCGIERTSVAAGKPPFFNQPWTNNTVKPFNRFSISANASASLGADPRVFPCDDGGPTGNEGSGPPTTSGNRFSY